MLVKLLSIHFFHIWTSKKAQNPHFFTLLTWKCASHHNGVYFFDISTSKSGPNPCVLYILTWKGASRHNGVHFFDISTSQSGLRMVCFLHFDVEMCFSPQRCTFSTSELPKVVWEWCVLCILTWKCASRHNCVHFFDIWTSKNGPDMVCFVHFDLETLQRRALFRHLNFQKWSKHGVFFWILDFEMGFGPHSLIWPAGSAPAALARLLSYIIYHISYIYI